MNRWTHIARTWGTTTEERQRPFPCDYLLPDFNDAYFRGVTVAVASPIVFRWLCQLRVAAYSYDWISHFGLRSARELTPGLEDLTVGQPVMRVFELAGFERDQHLTLRLRTPGIYPPLAVSYLIVPAGEDRCRLLVKLVVRFRQQLLDRLTQPVAPWLDWMMMRRQLLNLKSLAESMAPSS